MDSITVFVSKDKYSGGTGKQVEIDSESGWLNEVDQPGKVCTVLARLRRENLSAARGV